MIQSNNMIFVSHNIIFYAVTVFGESNPSTKASGGELQT